MVDEKIPELVASQSLQNLEITRLTQDPIFGQINTSKILQAERKIRENRIEEDPKFQEAMKYWAQKVKHPVTKEEIKLRDEYNKVKDSESLIKKMTDIIDD